MSTIPTGRGRPQPGFFAHTWLPAVLAAGLMWVVDQSPPMRLALSIYALIVTPPIWWWIARPGAHRVRRAAWAGALVVAALWAMLIGATVFETARHGTGDGGLGGLALIAAVLVLPLVGGASLLAGAGLGALVGVVQGLLPKFSPPPHAASAEGLPEAQATDSGLTREKLDSKQSALARWLDKGNRREQLKVMGPLMALPLVAVLSIGYTAFEWRRTEVHTEVAREISPRSHRVAAAFSHRWQWTRAHNHYDARVSDSGRDPARGRVVWDSSKVPITRLEWTDQDSLLVHVDMHNDEFVPWLTSTIRTHKVRGVPVRTVIKLTPDYLMVTNPRLPDDLQVRPEDIQLSGVPVSVGDSVMIHATIHNVGLRPAMGVEVEVSDDRFEVLLGKPKVDIPAGGSASIDVPWVPAAPDTHLLAVRVDAYVFPSEADYKNNFARIPLVVAKQRSAPH